MPTAAGPRARAERTRLALARVAAARMRRRAAHTPLPGVARKAQPAEAHRRLAALRAERRSRVADRRRSPDQRWRRTGSCLRANRSAREPVQNRDQQGAGSRPELAAAQARHRQVDGGRRGGPATVARRPEDRNAVGRAQARRAESPTRRPGEAALVAPRRAEARRTQAGELPQRPKDYRKIGKTCWWAGSTRRTACTRSCEKLPSSSCAPLTCAAKRREHTRFPRHYAVKGESEVFRHRAGHFGRDEGPRAAKLAEIRPATRGLRQPGVQRSFSSWMRAALPVRSRK